MTLKESKYKIIYIALISVLGIVVGGFIYRNESKHRWHDGRWIPITGLRLNPESSKGNIANGEKDMKEIYTSINKFIKENNRLPKSLAELVNFKDNQGNNILKKENIINDDYFYSDDIEKSKNRFNDYVLSAAQPRPNGQTKPIRPPQGERDIWAYTSIYTRDNAVVYRDYSQDQEPSGHHLVLWSDGVVEKVPNLDSAWYPDTTGGGYILSFKGQAGLPDSTLTQREKLHKTMEMAGNMLRVKGL